MQVCLFCCFLGFVTSSIAEPLIVDHSSTDITALPEAAIIQEKQTQHIAYGHISRGSQLITGMTGVVTFAIDGGRGLALSDSIFAWNNGGTIEK